MTAPTPIDFETLENAVHAWFAEATDLETVWALQSAPQPEYPFATLQIISGPRPVSHSWIEYTSTDLNRPVGSEIKIEKGVPCELTISCQVYVSQPDGSNPGYDSKKLMTQALGALYSNEVRDDFDTAGISVLRVGDINDVSELVGDEYVSRAAMDLEINSVLNVASYVGYIQKIQASSTDLGIDREFGDGVTL